jgi:hypothetical protein
MWTGGNSIGAAEVARALLNVNARGSHVLGEVLRLPNLDLVFHILGSFDTVAFNHPPSAYDTPKTNWIFLPESCCGRSGPL